MPRNPSKTYTYDAEGNLTAVDGGSTASYIYDALNHRVRTVVGSTAREFVFNASGQELSGGPAMDLGGSFGPVGLDVSSFGNVTTGTLTLGPGVGGKVFGAAGASYTAISISTNCKDMFP